MKSIFLYKKVIKYVFWAIISLIIFLTFQAIYATDNWKAFDIDFNKKTHIISAYGALIGAVLAFLSILFVLYQIYEQREQILIEKKDLVKEKKQDLKDRLLLLINYLIAMEKDIVSHGERMEVFFKLVRSNPSTMNTMESNTNKNFERVIEMDILSNFKAFQTFFDKDEENWQKKFVNLYETSDFYNESFKDLKKNYKLHIEDKFEKQKIIANDLKMLLNLNSRLIDDYRIKYSSGEYLKYSWSGLVNAYNLNYYDYLKQVNDVGSFVDFRHISQHFLFPFIQTAMDFRRDEGYDDLGSRNIIELASSIGKKIREIETYSLQYADGLDTQFNNYFSADNISIKELIGIRESLEIKVI